MSQFQIVTKDNAAAESAALLKEVEKKFGFVPNLMGIFAEAPVALRAYLELSNLVGQTSFSPEEQQAILLAVSLENNCEYCVAAHSMVAVKMAGMAPVRMKALRENSSLGDKKLDEIVNFTREVVRAKGHVGDKTITRFFDSGFSKQQLLEILVCVSMKTLSNYTNHIAKTPVDEAFSEFKWKPKSS